MRLIMSLVLALSLCLVNASHGHGEQPDPPTLPKPLKKQYCYVEIGAVQLNNITTEVGGYFMMASEVSNLHYREFLAYVKRNGQRETYEAASIDSTSWVTHGTLNEPFAEHYHLHPAYEDYPVVNISHEAAELYCEWLQMMLNRNFGDAYAFEVRLPTREEWVRASRPTHIKAPYSWGGYYLRNTRGEMLCNFNPIGAEMVSRNTKSGQLVVVDTASFPSSAAMLSPVRSFSASDHGIYNLNGNVAEMVANPDIAVGGSWNSPGFDVRCESIMPFEGPCPLVGFRPLVIVQQL